MLQNWFHVKSEWQKNPQLSTPQLKLTFIASTSMVEATKSPRPDVPASAFIHEVDNNLIFEAAEPTVDGSFWKKWVKNETSRHVFCICFRSKNFRQISSTYFGCDEAIDGLRGGLAYAAWHFDEFSRNVKNLENSVKLNKGAKMSNTMKTLLKFPTLLLWKDPLLSAIFFHWFTFFVKSLDF